MRAVGTSRLVSLGPAATAFQRSWAPRSASRTFPSSASRDGAFGISANELTACGRGEWPAVTMVVFRNYQWGAEKRNTTLWYQDNFVGTELNRGVEYAELAKACGLSGVKVETTDELEKALASSIEGQMQRNETTLIEVVLNQELGEPFRRDAMTAPVSVAGIRLEDMAE